VKPPSPLAAHSAPGHYMQYAVPIGTYYICYLAGNVVTGME